MSYGLFCGDRTKFCVRQPCPCVYGNHDGVCEPVYSVGTFFSAYYILPTCRIILCCDATRCNCYIFRLAGILVLRTKVNFFARRRHNLHLAAKIMLLMLGFCSVLATFDRHGWVMDLMVHWRILYIAAACVLLLIFILYFNNLMAFLALGIGLFNLIALGMTAPSALPAALSAANGANTGKLRVMFF